MGVISAEVHALGRKDNSGKAQRNQHIFASRADAETFSGREDDLKQRIQAAKGVCLEEEDLALVLTLLIPRKRKKAYWLPFFLAICFFLAIGVLVTCSQCCS